ncbi:MAG: DUF7536 family protein [Halobacteriota archaeon]
MTSRSIGADLAVRTESNVVNEDVPDRSPTAALFEELSVLRNARIGLVVGVGIAALLYVVRVFELLGPVAGTRRYPIFGAEGWFLVLAFVFAASAALLVTIVLTAVTAYRRTKAL